jgi:hypothetical protein
MVNIGRAVPVTFHTSKGLDAVRMADIPSASPALDRRHAGFLIGALGALQDNLKRNVLPPSVSEGSGRKISKWVSKVGRQLYRDGERTESIITTPELV